MLFLFTSQQSAGSKLLLNSLVLPDSERCYFFECAMSTVGQDVVIFLGRTSSWGLAQDFVYRNGSVACSAGICATILALIS